MTETNADTTVTDEDKVLGTGAVLHKVDLAGELLPENETQPDGVGVPSAVPTPSPAAEPHEEHPYRPGEDAVFEDVK